jgi:hypothetical protein
MFFFWFYRFINGSFSFIVGVVTTLINDFFRRSLLFEENFDG